jgi:trk system potassium uptake protein TrkH
MNFRSVLRFQGAIWVTLGVTMLVALIPAFFYHDGGVGALVGVGGVAIVLGGIAILTTRGSHEIRLRDALFSVTCAWFSASIVGALPYLCGGLLGITDALFESVSGFTTTGASVVNDVEAWPHAMLMWRALTHLLGGMGIVVMSVALLPLLGYGGVQLFQTEAVGPLKGKLTPQVRETARILWLIYLGLIAAGALLLLLGGMSLFDAICHSIAAIATGGFSTKNTSIGFYNSAYIDIVVIFLMLAGGTNFALHWYALRGKPSSYLKDPEFRFWMSLVAVAIVIITFINLAHKPEPFGQALRGAAFSVTTMVSTTGFVTVDFDNWTFAPKFILLMFLFTGSCAGSTCGSIKMFRWLVAVKAARLQMRKNLHPQAIMPLRVGGGTVPDEVVKSILLFIVTYIGMVALGAWGLMLTGLDLQTALSGTAACAAGCGPGMGGLGALETYFAIAPLAKYILILEMLLGRLEIFSLIVIFTRGFWHP